MSINFMAYHKLRQNISTNSTKIGLVFLVAKGGKFWEDIMVLVIFKVFNWNYCPEVPTWNIYVKEKSLV